MQPIKNQWKHLVVASYFGLWAGVIHALINKIPKTEASLWLFMVFIAAGIMLKFEFVQGNVGSPRPEKGKNILQVLKEWWERHWAHRWLDSLLDWCFGVIGFILGMLPFWAGWLK